MAVILLFVAGCQDQAVEEATKPEKDMKKTINLEEAELGFIIKTDKGDIKGKFYPDVAPNTVLNFVELARSNFYDGLTFHRVEPGFVIQGGDPQGTGTGGPGYSIPAEFNDKPHKLGALAMARSADPDSAGSQFYITLDEVNQLDGNYTVFGEVTEGMPVAFKIEKGDVIQTVEITGQLPKELQNREVEKNTRKNSVVP